MLTGSDRVVVYVRQGCHVCARVKQFLTEQDVRFEVRDVDADPLTPRELWTLFNHKAGRLRVPFTALNDGEDVVLGYDRLRLEGVFVEGDLGGWQTSSQVQGSQVYDEFTSPTLDDSRWAPAGLRPGHVDEAARADIRTGTGELAVQVHPFAGFHETDQLMNDAQHLYVSTERFGTPAGSCVSFDVSMAVETLEQHAGSLDDAYGAACICDLTAGFRLGFGSTGDTVFALHERLPLPGVTAENERYSHKVVLPIATGQGKRHDFTVRYRQDTSLAQWFVDGTCVYWATVPRPVEGFSLSMGLYSSVPVDQEPLARRQHGQGARATWGPWRIADG